MKYFLFFLFLSSTLHAKDIHLIYDFNDGLQGWDIGFADYPAGDEEFMELEGGIRNLPPEISTERQGLLISGNNHSDDLYMYMTKEIGRVEGLIPGKSYEVWFKTTFDSNAASGCLGTGGAPGESVFLKGNALAQSPETFVDDLNHVRTFFDHGPVISHIANGIDCEEERGEYVSLTRTGPTLKARVSKGGSLWLVLGTDSGFESTTALYYEKIEVTLKILDR